MIARLVLVSMLAGAPLGAETPARGPALAAASNLSQGWQPEALAAAERLGVGHLRDGMEWRRVEPVAGLRDFRDPRVRYPDALARAGIGATVVLNWGNPAHDDGATPHSDAGLAAFGAYAGALVLRFPGIDALEIGNEFNGVNFVRGPLQEMAPLDRARAYVPLLRAAARAAREARPGVRILGGATHSIAAGYLWAVLDAGGAEWMDALAIHPYTTPAEQFRRQVAVLRRHPAAADLPIEITEFGSPDPDTAADHFLRNYCQMALAGVVRAAWYPLNRRGDGLVPLYGEGGQATSAGQAWRLIAARMEGRAVRDAAPGRFSYGCRFGADTLVLWGERREVAVTPGTVVLDARGAPSAPPHALDPEAPLVFVADDVEAAVSPARVSRLADSLHQFAFPAGAELRAGDDGFARFARRDGVEHPLVTLPGQERRGVPWFPYRGNPDLGRVRLTHDSLLPGGRRGHETEIVHRWIAPENGPVRVTARFAVAARSADGIAVRLTLNGASVARGAGHDPIRFDTVLDLSAGDRIELAAGPNGNADGDVTRYRIVLQRP
ncbi:hypothetical protein E2L08_07175 [Palleronia sediminis]|uniref:Asl1-like glycosyl hydrolase catalytic domain-containing protein n=1 Tax=Palleronia sediminis TaxID=2547833 RepID=A0A4R6ADL9_9RHOB|nr:hypothetical protein [Palleronia sediminis]TDL81112.1 hypothetical protein E2L08_07175 [Palleronia sediminis]